MSKLSMCGPAGVSGAVSKISPNHHSELPMEGRHRRGSRQNYSQVSLILSHFNLNIQMSSAASPERGSWSFKRTQAFANLCSTGSALYSVILIPSVASMWRRTVVSLFSSPHTVHVELAASSEVQMYIATPRARVSSRRFGHIDIDLS